MIASLGARFQVPLRVSNLNGKLIIAVATTAMADWLFWEQTPGLSVVLFTLLLAGAVLSSGVIRTSGGDRLLAAGFLAAGLIPIFEDVNALSLFFAVAGMSAFSLIMAGQYRGTLGRRICAQMEMIVMGLGWLFVDLSTARAASHRFGRPRAWKQWLADWLNAIFFGSIFVILLVMANPLIENVFLYLDPASVISWENFARLIFWLFVFAAAWPFLRPRIRRTDASRLYFQGFGPGPDLSRFWALFNTVAIRRSLVLFNLLFAAQTAMDMAYLWSGAALPDGMNYATYAHRGAYPLIATALLTGAFVLVAMRRGAAPSEDGLVRFLVYLWIGQNVLLVVSSMLRLYLYVEVYSLTYWRFAAFVWMLLVTCGLVLIVARVALGRTNLWLVTANGVALAIALYACAFLNIPRIIAVYNVFHSLEAGFSRQVQHLMFSRNASAGVLYPRHFLGVELTAHVISSISRAV